MRINRSNMRPGAFSLVELVLVLTILAVLGSLAAPRYLGALSNYRADAAARRVAADLQLLRASARGESTPWSITFDSAADRYRLMSADQWVQLAIAPYRADLVSVKITPQGGSTITFDGYGQADGDAVITVQSGDAVRSIRVDASSGEVSVQ